MNGFAKKDGMAGISLRHLEVFSTVVRERSYANASVDLNMSRPNVKRVCEEFERIVGRKLLLEKDAKEIGTTEFGQGLFGRLGPLSTSLRKMEESVKKLHQAGRVLRFGAAGGFFRSGLFTDYLARLEISDKFRPCFLRVEPEMAGKSLLAAECDVYFGIGLSDSERLERVDLGMIGWKISQAGGGKGKLPNAPNDLGGKWLLLREGDRAVCEKMLENIRGAGATGGEIADHAQVGKAENGTVVIAPDMLSPLGEGLRVGWPGYRFYALMRKYHPYSDLKETLCAGAGKESHGC